MTSIMLNCPIIIQNCFTELRSMSAGLGISPKSSKSVFNAQPKKQNENDKISVIVLII